MSLRLSVGILTFGFGTLSISQANIITRDVPLPELNRTVLQPHAKFDNRRINESSGLVRARSFDGYWTLNDSGDSPRIFPITADGKTVGSSLAGIAIPEARNRDWEAIGRIDDKRLVVADFGNNGNARRNLCLYLVEEVDPLNSTEAVVWLRVPFHYPDQAAFPGEVRNFDAEAIFCWGESIYFFTKHRSDSRTKLYRLPLLEVTPEDSVPAQLLGHFSAHEQVTGADISPSGQQVAVLTRKGVWLFEDYLDPAHLLLGKVSFLSIAAKQCEAITFEGEDSLLISNEQAELFRLSTKDLVELDDTGG